jgi:hypothetical protein
MLETPEGPFNQALYYAAYKQIRNMFRKYDSLGVICACLNYLHAPTQDQSQQLLKQPWLVLLLVKWILIDDEFDAPGKKPIPREKRDKLLGMVHNLGDVARHPLQFDHLHLFFRSIAYQQFLYQSGFSIDHFSRQSLLFSGLPENSLIGSTFRRHVGLDVQKFLDLSMIVLIKFVTEKNSALSLDWFSSVRQSYSSSEIDCFLKSVALPFLESRKSLRERDGRKRSGQEYYEQTPFIEFPLVRTAEEYVCIYPSVLYRCLEYFIYDHLKVWASQEFMAKFGPMFEEYVQKTIRYTGLPYVSEDLLKRELGPDGKLIDFLIVDGEANIFVDAKAVEMSYQGKVSHLSEVIKDKTKNSVIKAIKQAHDVLRRLQHHQSSHPLLRQRSQNYLIVVTFKELHLGNGLAFYESVATDAINEIHRAYSGYPQIHPEDMYFLAIEDFDNFAELIAAGNIGLREGIERVKESDADPRTRKFGFGQHLESWKNGKIVPSFLKSKSDEIFERLRSIINEQQVDP